MRIMLLTALTIPLIAFGDEIDTELSRRSLIPEERLAALLADCQRYQLNMNICSFRDFIRAELKMKDLVQKKIELLPACKAELLASQTEWEHARDQRCDSEANEQAEGGSMRPMVYTSCQRVVTEDRIAKLQDMHECRSIP